MKSVYKFCTQCKRYEKHSNDEESACCKCRNKEKRQQKRTKSSDNETMSILY